VSTASSPTGYTVTSITYTVLSRTRHGKDHTVTVDHRDGVIVACPCAGATIAMRVGLLRGRGTTHRMPGPVLVRNSNC
jgi:hypothetical protein